MGLKTLRRPYNSDEKLNKRSEQLCKHKYTNTFGWVQCDKCGHISRVP